MLSYYQLTQWHAKFGEEQDSSELGDSFNKQYIRKKLEGGLGRVWHDVQSKVSVYLTNSDLAWYKFEQFVQVLSIVHRWV